MRALMIATTLLLLAGPARAEEVKFDFRGRALNDQFFRFDGPTPEQFLTREDEGLRLRFGPETTTPRNTGLAWDCHLLGDFEVTAAYEVLQNDRPEKGWGAGVELYLMLGNATRDGVAFARLIRPADGLVFTFSHMTKTEDGKRVPKVSRREPTTVARTKQGRLRLTRKGPTITASFAEGDQEAFKDLFVAEVGTEPVYLTRFAGVSGGDPDARLDARLQAFQVKADELSWQGRAGGPLPTEAAGVPTGRGSGWLFWTVAGVVVAALGILLTLRLRRPRAVASTAVPPSKPAPPSAKPAAPPAPATAITKAKPPTQPRET